MCIGCDWAKYRHLNADYRPQGEGGLSRRQVLGGGALFTATAVAALSAPPPVFAAEATDASADIVFKNGPVYTVDAVRPWARAVAVKGKRIVYVGDEAGVQSFAGPRTRVVTLPGRCCFPASSKATFTRSSGRP